MQNCFDNNRINKAPFFRGKEEESLQSAYAQYANTEIRILEEELAEVKSKLAAVQKKEDADGLTTMKKELGNETAEKEKVQKQLQLEQAEKGQLEKQLEQEKAEKSQMEKQLDKEKAEKAKLTTRLNQEKSHRLDYIKKRTF